MDSKAEWKEFDRESRRAGSRLALWIVLGVAFTLLLGGGIYALKVATAPAKGWGDEQIIVNDGRNRVNAQEWFAGKYGHVRGQDSKLSGMKAAWDSAKGTADEGRLRDAYTGTQNLCLQAVAEYNAEALKVSRGRWRSPDLPFSLPDGPATDCDKAE